MLEPGYVKVWDPLIRLFHWTLVAAFTLAYATEDEWLSLHVLAGYVILVLLAFRLVWGLVGTRHARFSSFLCRPSVTLDYLHDLVLGQARRYLGHNPAGAMMILALLIGLLLSSLTGLMIYAAEQQAGPLAGWFANVSHTWEEILEEVHELFANLTLFLVLLHVVGVVVSSYLHGENLVRAMLTGHKRESLD
jgi:cytochrome b